jgi:hypothetical protein
MSDIFLFVFTSGEFELIDIGHSDLLDLNDYFEKFRIELTVVHPDFTGDITMSNLMLVKLDGITTFSPVTLNKNPAVPSQEGEELTALGFDDGERNTFQEVVINYIPNDVCEGLTDPSLDISLEGEINDDNICADAPGRGICTGDYGGPLIISGTSADEDLQVGVTAA